eukprot:COSAG02_NODE_3937_length_6020_cov_16.468502_4_plen_68_part_00
MGAPSTPTKLTPTIVARTLSPRGMIEGIRISYSFGAAHTIDRNNSCNVGTRSTQCGHIGYERCLRFA